MANYLSTHRQYLLSTLFPIDKILPIEKLYDALRLEEDPKAQQCPICGGTMRATSIYFSDTDVRPHTLAVCDSCGREGKCIWKKDPPHVWAVLSIDEEPPQDRRK